MSSITSELANESRLSASNPLDAVPDGLPFDVPYGPPVSLARAQAVIDAAVAEAMKRNWKMNVAVADSRGNLGGLPTHGRMPCLASIQNGAAQGTAAVTFHASHEDLRGRRQSDASQLSPRIRWSHIASRGGIPLIDRGAIIGAIGCSGGTDSQDEIVSNAGAAVVNQLQAANK